jgi:predicted Fe-S protein YdhL (DUF1289 family)
MADEIRNRDGVDSPCIRVCTVHPGARICTGCLRSIDEIARWSTLSAECSVTNQFTRIIHEKAAGVA